MDDGRYPEGYKWTTNDGRQAVEDGRWRTKNWQVGYWILDIAYWAARRGKEFMEGPAFMEKVDPALSIIAQRFDSVTVLRRVQSWCIGI